MVDDHIGVRLGRFGYNKCFINLTHLLPSIFVVKSKCQAYCFDYYHMYRVREKSTGAIESRCLNIGFKICIGNVSLLVIFESKHLITTMALYYNMAVS